MSEPNSILLCGLPESGKSTFIAALWYQLFNNEINTLLKLDGLPTNRKYLNKISRDWSKFSEIGHTPTDESQKIEITLRNDEKAVSLQMPDMSGETWQRIWNNGTCNELAAYWANKSNGIMLFLHSDKIRHYVDIETMLEMSASAGKNVSAKGGLSWAPEKSPTQVILVQILQELSQEPIGAKGKKLAVIVSAWDKAEDTGLSPSDYVKSNLPLLHQFLSFCNRFEDIKIFGISALGGDLNDDSAKLKAEDLPSKRVKVVSNAGTGHDLTEPINWLYISEYLSGEDSYKSNIAWL